MSTLAFYFILRNQTPKENKSETMILNKLITSQLSATGDHLTGPNSKPSGRYYLHDIGCHSDRAKKRRPARNAHR